jgi:hypothetical protein
MEIFIGKPLAANRSRAQLLLGMFSCAGARVFIIRPIKLRD